MKTSAKLILLLVVLMSALAPTATSFAAEWPSGGVRVALDARRIGGADRYATSVAIARDGFPGWTDVDHVVITSGEGKAIADAVAAGGLVWAYEAPLMLVKGKSVPPSVRTALQEIRSANETVTVTIVGGTPSVASACARQIEEITGPGSVRRIAGSDRYATAARVASEMHTAAVATGRSLAPVALIANGTDASGFYDALALSAVSARIGAPVLFVSKSSAPYVTRSQLSALAADEVIVAGSAASVSGTVYSAIGGSVRVGGSDRYGTAVEVAELARARGWLDGSEVAVVGAVVDAVSGAGAAGRRSAPVVFTEKWRLSPAPANYIAGLGDGLSTAVVFGDPMTVSSSTFSQLRGAPAIPSLVAPASGQYVAKYAYVKVKTGVNTTQVKLYSGSTLIGTAEVDSFGTADFGKRAMPSSGVTLRAVASNPDGGSTERSNTYKRLSYPSSTSIVIDKSDFRLYWVKSDVLIEAFPIATGRPGMETPVATWKIMAKYKTDPSSVYGPRKMRLFRRVISGDSVKYVYTAYAVHGTNEPWVIGTKASHGCIRMYNEDVLRLWPQVPIGTLVQTRE